MRSIGVSIIIPTMNRYNSLLNTIKSISKSHYIPDEIIVIDQSFEFKDIYEEVKKYLPTSEFIQHRQNKPSLTKARNIGVELAKNEILIFCDDDIEFENDTLSNTIKLFNNDNFIVAIGGINTNVNSSFSICSKVFDTFFLTRKVMNKKGYVLESMVGRYPENIKTIVETQWLMGYFFAVKGSYIKANNILWDENLLSYAYPEDLDFSYSLYKTAIKDGKKLVLSPDIRVKHLETKEWRVTPKKHIFMYVINRRYLTYKHFNTKRAIIKNNWTNCGELIRRILKSDNYKDMIKAIRAAKRYDKDIKNGNIPYEIFN